ncbi:response regulator [Deminuibacter soli]|uniref:Response regulator n=1 Tax=Deminuibacter soli TaxID=2291815 RepID=A0A3E1ND43_9BACT|nr:response regulator [Deminuibacter soli]RFM25782.1 response regulator [Deminuibacter soli]
MTNPRKKILIADDDPDDREMLIEFITGIEPGIQISAVNNGQQALQYLARLPDEALPNLLVLDYKMPMLNASEVLEKLAIETRYNSISKVVWSTSQQQDGLNRCINAGAVRYFIKPGSTNALRQLATEMLQLITSVKR